MAASSLGNAPRFLMIFRKDRFTDSTVLVVYMIFRISAGKAKKGMTCSQFRFHIVLIVRYCLPHFSANRFSSCWAASRAWGSVYFLQVVRDRLSVFGAHIVQAVPHQMDNAELYLSLRVDALDGGLREILSNHRRKR